MGTDSIQRLFLEHPDFNPQVIERAYPNARRILSGGLFISHSGVDYLRVRRDIVLPSVIPLFGNSYFLHNRGTGAAERYRDLIQAALTYCTSFLVAVSKNSLSNDWVRAEVGWAIAHNRPVVACLLDETSPNDFGLTTDWLFADFQQSVGLAQTQLKNLLGGLRTKTR
ncbi:MAG: hypothetical protein ACLQIB_13090 [Isosphaeraceae bacterium]